MNENPLRWRRIAGGPVIRPGTLNPPWDALGSGSCCVIAENGGYRMYYTGINAMGLCVCEAYADAADPHHWMGRGCSLRPPDGVRHLCRGVSYPWVVARSPDPWLMFLAGWAEPTEAGKLPNTLNVALSRDEGRSWAMASTHPILAHDRDYDREGIGSACGLRDGGIWRMYYTAISGYSLRPEGLDVPHVLLPHIGIGYAESEDGRHWRKPFNEYLVSPRYAAHEPFEYVVSKPCVIRDVDCWRMWVSSCGRRYRIRSLVSDNGLDWRWVSSPEDGELGLGPPGSFDDNQNCYACVIPTGAEYRMWYTGNDFGRTGIGYAVASASR